MTVPSSAKRRLLPLSVILGGPIAGLLLFVRCFNPALPTCSYRCDTASRACPPEYECRSDAICHLKGSTEACSFSVDFSVRPDQATPADQSPAADSSTLDM